MVDDIILNVPYVDKDAAKALGAKWNPKIKRWYIQSHQDVSKFSTWLPTKSNHALCMAYSPIFLIKSWERCWNCTKISNVYGLATHCFQEAEEATPINDFFIFSFIEYIPIEIKKYLTKISTSYFVDYSKTTNSSYLMNHCMYCHKGFGDFYMHNELESAFSPLHADECKNIYISHLPIEACEITADYHFGESETLILEHANFVNLHEIFEDFQEKMVNSLDNNDYQINLKGSVLKKLYCIFKSIKVKLNL